MTFEPRVIKVIETWELEGSGTKEKPFTRVRHIWELNGDLIARCNQ